MNKVFSPVLVSSFLWSRSCCGRDNFGYPRGKHCKLVHNSHQVEHSSDATGASPNSLSVLAQQEKAMSRTFTALLQGKSRFGLGPIKGINNRPLVPPPTLPSPQDHASDGDEQQGFEVVRESHVLPIVTNFNNRVKHEELQIRLQQKGESCTPPEESSTMVEELDQVESAGPVEKGESPRTIFLKTEEAGGASSEDLLSKEEEDEEEDKQSLGPRENVDLAGEFLGKIDGRGSGPRFFGEGPPTAADLDVPELSISEEDNPREAVGGGEFRPSVSEEDSGRNTEEEELHEEDQSNEEQENHKNQNVEYTAGTSQSNCTEESGDDVLTELPSVCASLELGGWSTLHQQDVLWKKGGSRRSSFDECVTTSAGGGGDSAEEENWKSSSLMESSSSTYLDESTILDGGGFLLSSTAGEEVVEHFLSPAESPVESDTQNSSDEDGERTGGSSSSQEENDESIITSSQSGDEAKERDFCEDSWGEDLSQESSGGSAGEAAPVSSDDSGKQDAVVPLEDPGGQQFPGEQELPPPPQGSDHYLRKDVDCLSSSSDVEEVAMNLKQQTSGDLSDDLPSVGFDPEDQELTGVAILRRAFAEPGTTGKRGRPREDAPVEEEEEHNCGVAVTEAELATSHGLDDHVDDDHDLDRLTGEFGDEGRRKDAQDQAALERAQRALENMPRTKQLKRKKSEVEKSFGKRVVRRGSSKGGKVDIQSPPVRGRSPPSTSRPVESFSPALDTIQVMGTATGSEAAQVGRRGLRQVSDQFSMGNNGAALTTCVGCSLEVDCFIMVMEQFRIFFSRPDHIYFAYPRRSDTFVVYSLNHYSRFPASGLCPGHFCYHGLRPAEKVSAPQKIAPFPQAGEFPPRQNCRGGGQHSARRFSDCFWCS